jgi:hypothetical protein
MRLAAGTRVGLELEEGVTCVAVIRVVDGDAIDVELLEPVDYRCDPDAEILVFAPDVDGLHYWRAFALRPAVDGVLSLSLVGPSGRMQRRQYPRYAVDLRAEIRPVRGGLGRRPSEVHVIDLSDGGAKIVGTTPTETGDTVIINLDLGAGPLVATARVAMAYPDGEGRRVSHLAFTPPEDSVVALLGIHRYLSTLTSPSPSPSPTRRGGPGQK